MNKRLPTWATVLMVFIGISMLINVIPFIIGIVGLVAIVYFVKYVLERSKDVVVETKEQFAAFTQERDTTNRLPAWKEYNYIEKRLIEDDSKYVKRLRHQMFEAEQDGFKYFKQEAKELRNYIKEGDISRDVYLIFDKNAIIIADMARDLKAISLDKQPSPVVEAKIKVMWRELRHMHNELINAMKAHAKMIENDYLGEAREEREELEKLMAAREQERQAFEQSMKQ